MQVGLDVLKSCFPSKLAGWKSKLTEMVPSYGEKLNSDPAKARENMAYTAKVLELWGGAGGLPQGLESIAAPLPLRQYPIKYPKVATAATATPADTFLASLAPDERLAGRPVVHALSEVHTPGMMTVHHMKTGYETKRPFKWGQLGGWDY